MNHVTNSADADDHEAAGPTLALLLGVYAALMVLLVLTVAAAFLPFGEWSVAVAMVIATIKATVVLLWFMHLRYESGLVRVFAGAGLFWLLILMALTLADYVARTAMV